MNLIKHLLELRATELDDVPQDVKQHSGRDMVRIGNTDDVQQVVDVILRGLFNFPDSTIERIYANSENLVAASRQLKGMGEGGVSSTTLYNLGRLIDSISGADQDEDPADEYDSPNDMEGGDEFDDLNSIDDTADDKFEPEDVSFNVSAPSRRESFLQTTIDGMLAENQREIWINTKLEQLKSAAQEANRPFNETKIKQQLVARYQEELQKNPRSVQLEVRAAKERSKI